jgi:hypothetical protein
MTDPDRLPELYLAIFEHDARGAALLDDLHARFGTPKVVTDGGIDAVLKTYKSTGQSLVIAYILSQIARAKGDRPINMEPDEDPTA